MYIFERSVTCSFSQELYSHIDKNSGGGGESEGTFLIKMAKELLKALCRVNDA